MLSQKFHPPLQVCAHRVHIQCRIASSPPASAGQPRTERAPLFKTTRHRAPRGSSGDSASGLPGGDICRRAGAPTPRAAAPQRRSAGSCSMQLRTAVFRDSVWLSQGSACGPSQGVQDCKMARSLDLLDGSHHSDLQGGRSASRRGTAGGGTCGQRSGPHPLHPPQHAGPHISPAAKPRRTAPQRRTAAKRSPKPF